MRLIWVTCIGLFFAGTASSMARDYPWCERTSFNGFNPSCSFTSYQQCMATVSGQRGDCILNPRLAFGEQRRRGRAPRDWNGGWDNGWNPRW